MSTKNAKATKKPVSVKTKITARHNANKRTQPNTSSSLQLIRTTVNMDKILHGKIKQFAAKNNLSINGLINTPIKQYIKK